MGRSACGALPRASRSHHPLPQVCTAADLLRRWGRKLACALLQVQQSGQVIANEAWKVRPDKTPRLRAYPHHSCLPTS